jgi:hypothetical protein
MMTKRLTGFIASLLFSLSTVSLQAQDIIFSDTPFADADRKGKDKVFSMTDKIYARLLLPKSAETDLFRCKIAERYKENFLAQMEIYSVPVDIGTPTRQVFLWVPDSDLKKQYLDFEILPPDKANTVYFERTANLDHPLLVFSDERVMQTDGGVAKLEITIAKSNEPETFKGSFRVKTERSDKATFQKVFNEKIRPAMQSKLASTQSLPEVFRKKTPPFKDKMLSEDGIKKIVMEELRDIEIFAVKIDDNDSKDYIVQLNNFGNPIKQYTARNIYVAYKVKGKCEYIRVILERPHLGGGKYGDFSIIVEDKAVEMGCDALKK